MNRLLIRIACLSASILFSTVVFADETQPPPDRYEVELIVFRHVDQARNTPEIPAARSIFRSSPLDLTVAEMPAVQDQAEDELPDAIGRKRSEPVDFLLLELDPTYPDFVPLDASTRSLNQTYARLVRIDAYEPLLHVGWVQSARSSDSALPYRIEPTTTANGGISGTVTLYKSRFLHLELDLALEEPYGTTERRFLSGSSAGAKADSHKLTESRRIRGTAAHYFDHPQFGVIARIQNIKDADAQRGDAG